MVDKAAMIVAEDIRRWRKRIAEDVNIRITPLLTADVGPEEKQALRDMAVNMAVRKLIAIVAILN